MTRKLVCRAGMSGAGEGEESKSPKNLYPLPVLRRCRIVYLHGLLRPRLKINIKCSQTRNILTEATTKHFLGEHIQPRLLRPLLGDAPLTVS
jgi:hypothetical protein